MSYTVVLSQVLGIRRSTLKYSCRPAVVLALASLVLLFPAQVSAQQTPYVVGSTVTGRVLCADSNAPARFAKVLLKSTEPDHSGEDLMKNMMEGLMKATAKGSSNDGQATSAAPPVPAPKPMPPISMTDDQKLAMAAANKGMSQTMDMLNATTVGLDGAYSFSGVKPGTYYVHAIFPGYIDPFSQLSDDDFASTDPAARARVAQIPTITVSGTDSAHIDLRLERGAAVSGRILFDDGSPAAGWVLSVIKTKTPEDPGEAVAAAMSQALAMSGAAQIFKTDDLGHYRISGLPAGDYALRANLVAPAVGINATNIGDGGSGINLVVYTGDTFNRAAAKSISLTPGEEHSGVDIVVPARSLHNITGHVVAKSDAHTLNVGSVTLTSKNNKALHAKAAIRDDGSFHFEYLPSGVTYTLTVDDAADGRKSGATDSFMGLKVPHPEILHKYGTDTTEILLADTDIDSVRLTVAQTDWTPPAKKPGTVDITPGDLLNGLFSSGPPDKP